MPRFARRALRFADKLSWRRPMHFFAQRWADFIMWIGNGTGLPDTVLHIHAGLAVLVLARLVTRRSLGSFVPLSIVALAEAANEVLDRIQYHSWRWPDTTSDVIHTMFWPTVICIGIRLSPLLPSRDRSAVKAPIPVDEAA